MAALSGSAAIFTAQQIIRMAIERANVCHRLRNRDPSNRPSDRIFTSRWLTFLEIRGTLDRIRDRGQKDVRTALLDMLDGGFDIRRMSSPS